MSNFSDKNNMVILKGKIVNDPVFSHSCMGENFQEVILEIERLSGECDYIPLTISSRLNEKITKGKTIGVFGNFRSYNKIENGKSKLVLTVFVREFINPDEIENSNQISVTGYICKTPIYRTTPFGREICDLIIAVNRGYNKSDYLPAIAWGRNAKFVSNSVVGDKVELCGRIQSRNYQKKLEDGTVENRTAYEVSITTLSLAENNQVYECKSHQFMQDEYNPGEVCFVTC